MLAKIQGDLHNSLFKSSVHKLKSEFVVDISLSLR